VLHEFVASAGDDEIGPEYHDLLEAWCRWLWLPYGQEGPFNFGDEEYFRSGVAFFSELVCKRYTRGMPLVVLATRSCLGIAAMLYRLRARVDVRAICIREREAAGWPEVQ
jgi:hypothetical protein